MPSVDAPITCIFCFDDFSNRNGHLMNSFLTVFALCVYSIIREWSGGGMVLGKLPLPGVLQFG